MTQKIATTDAGAPVPSVEHSLTVGPDGPILLQDHYLIEQMANFNRERIPERQPHAKGGGAFGRFEVTQDVSKYTKAALFQPGATTEMVARFSTVAGERGSPDTWRDPRGFALKFYTSEGNFDMVGNNTPVFFVRDPMKFQNFIRSQKRMQMLLARGFSYADAHRARLGVNYKQIPVNEPKVEVNAYSKDGAMRIRNAADPVYTPNSMGGPVVDDPKRVAEAHWMSDGDMVRTAYTLRAEDDDWGQAGTMVREVLDDAARDRLAHNIIGHVSDGVKEPVLSRVFEYWRNVDAELGKKVEEGVRANLNGDG